MSLFGLFAILITVTALLSYVNERWLRLPPTIGVMVAALVFSGIFVLSGQLGLSVQDWAEGLLERLDFGAVLMRGMLSFLLFAGALHVDLGSLLGRKWSILSMATLGVMVSTFLVGTATWWLFGLVGIDLPYVHALLFGALISPTDPIAVLGILKTTNISKELEAMIAGESLFNDGVGVVMFTMILGFLSGGHHSLLGVLELFLLEAFGGVVVGFGLGYITYRLLRSVDNPSVEALITLALVAGGYVLAGALHTSGPIAMVVAGLFIGNHGRAFGMSDQTRERLDNFWELIDEILNALLFVMIGFELLVLDVEPAYVLAGLLAIPVVVVARFTSVGLPIALLRRVRSFLPYTVTMIAWCGVRGGISIALALSLPASSSRDLILLATYVVVVFTILVQGLTVGRLARWVAVRTPEERTT
jgi:CPA1 family monovalent cation:H+ antiporter